MNKTIEIMEVRACRICLAIGVQMYKLCNEPMKSATENFICIMDEPPTFPKYACFECAHMLKKFLKLLTKSRSTQTLLYEIYNEQGEVKETTIESLHSSGLVTPSHLSINYQGPESIIEVHHSENINNGDSITLSLLVENGKEYCNDNNSSDLVLEESNSPIGKEIVVETPQCSQRKTKSKIIKSKKANRTLKKNKSKNVADKKTSNQSNKNETLLCQRKRSNTLDKQLSKCFTIVTLSYEEQLQEVQSRRNSAMYASAPHKCELCFRAFRRLGAYTNHMAEHDSNRGPLECAVCRKRFATHLVLSRHIVCSHERQYRCRHCPVVCKARQAALHMYRHDGVVQEFKCLQCSFVTDKHAKYLRHRRHSHRRYACERCGRCFATERGLTIHRKRAHITEQSGTVATHRCEACDISFSTANAWKVHLLTSDKHKEEASNVNICKKCYATFDSMEELAAHNNQAHAADNVYPRNCTLCSTVLTSNREHWLHTVHNHPTEKKNYRSPIQCSLCEVCGRGFKSVTDLRMHSLRHTGARSVPCDFCPQLFYDPYQMRTHVKIVHSEDRPHKCPLCELRFKVKGNMKRHMLVHTGHRPHACSMCEKTFTQSGSRDLHVRTVHQRMPHPPRRRNKHKAKIDA